MRDRSRSWSRCRVAASFGRALRTPLEGIVSWKCLQVGSEIHLCHGFREFHLAVSLFGFRNYVENWAVGRDALFSGRTWKDRSAFLGGLLKSVSLPSDECICVKSIAFLDVSKLLGEGSRLKRTGWISVSESEVASPARILADIVDGFEEQLIDHGVKSFRASSTVQTRIRVGDMGLVVRAVEVLAVPADWK